jgi:Predicted membrane protein (DUF2142)
MTTQAEPVQAEPSDDPRPTPETPETDAERDDSPPRPGALRAGICWVQRHLGLGAAAFVVVAAVFGAVFSVVTPPFWGHDEITQFGRSYQVAQGGFLPERIADDRGVSYGGQIPLTVDAMMNYAFKDYNRKPQEPAPLSAGRDAYDRLGDAPVSSATKPMWFTNTAAYSPVPYVPAALAIRLAGATGMTVGQTVVLTRLAGLLAYLVIVGFALRALRGYRVQWLAFTVAVLPIALFQAGTVTADTMTNALAILVSCLLVKGLFLDAKLSRGEVAAALLATLALPVSKPTYVLLAMLVALIPARRYGFRERLRWIPWGYAILGAVLFAAWMKVAAPTGDGMGLMRPPAQWYSVRTGDQLHQILAHPLHFAHTFEHSIWLRDDNWFTEFFGQLGFAYIDVPAISILACLLAFAVSVGIAERLSAAQLRTVLVGLAIAASVAMIYVTLYMSFSPVGYYLIDGVQGRYFVPLAIVGFAVLLRWIPLRLTNTAGRTPVRGPAIAVVAATVFALVAAVLKYHYMVWG